MGDGQRRESGLVLCTDSYTIKEVVSLVNVLIIRYNLICTIWEPNKGQFRIYIAQKSMDNLREIVLPYIHDTMLYKLNIDHNKKPIGRLHTKIFIDNITTGDNFHYESISAAAKAIDVSLITIKKYLISGELLKNTYYIKGEKKGKHYTNI